MYTKSTDIITTPLGHRYTIILICKHVIQRRKYVPTEGKFYIGDNPEYAPVSIRVSYPHRYSTYETTDTAFLSLHRYYESHTEDIFLDLVKTSLSYVKYKCPFIKEFGLSTSMVRIATTEFMIALPYLCIAQHGKSWAEWHFGGQLKDSFYDMYPKALDDIMNMPIPDFDIFSNEHIQSSNTPKSIIDELRSIHKPHMTVRTFFDAIYAKHTTNMAHLLLQPWIEAFLREDGGILHGLNVLIWYISADRIGSYG
jgi:hypothetical protein